MYIDLKRIEFIVTDACSGFCKHCSNGDRKSAGGGVDADAAVTAVKRLAERFHVESVMTFGGEPLLYADTVCQIHAAARDCGIPIRQLITNGFFSRDKAKIDQVAHSLCAFGVNDVLLSVDAFHQEHIPLEPVMHFAEALLYHAIPSLRIQPAWLVSETHDNPYNTETKRLLCLFADKGIPINAGNIIFPSGNALKYLAEWFPASEEADLSAPCGSAPYTSRLDEITSIGIGPNGDVNACALRIGNICRQDALDIVDQYDPYCISVAQALLKGGAAELLRYANSVNVAVDTSDCLSACGVCRKAIAAMDR